MQNKLIIVSGDSFSTGEELAADLYIKNYTKNLYKKGEKLSSQRKKLIDDLRNAVGNDYHTIYTAECKKKAWPAYLENFLKDTTVINCSKSGISNEEIAFRAVETFFRFKDKFSRQNIKVIIMMTSWNRFGYPVYDKNYIDDYSFKSYMSYDAEKVSPSWLTSDVRHFFLNLTEHDRLVKSLQALSFCKNFFESNNIKIHFTDSCLFDFELRNFQYENKEKVLYYKNIIPIFCKLGDVPGEHVLPNYHYTEKSHEQFAMKLASLI